MTTTLDTHLSPSAPSASASSGSPRARASLGALELVDLLLRDRQAFLARIDEATDLLPTARALLITTMVSTAAFGASMGAYRGGVQLLFAAVKLPLALLLTASLVAPALTGLGLAARASDSPLELGRRFSRDLVLVLATLAIAGLVIAALTPVVVLAEIFGASYHELILTLVGACGLGGVVGLAFFFRGMARGTGRGRTSAALGTLALFVVVASQMVWSLRPFLVRPRTEQVPFVRAVEGSLLDSVTRSADSARGVYIDPVLERDTRSEEY